MRRINRVDRGEGPELSTDWSIGKVLASPYAGFMRLRRAAYHKGWLRSSSAGVPVICVGNLTMGGTGKTPVVAWVVEQLKAAGKHPAILTRGYKAVDGVSDEAELLKQTTGVPVVINPDRIAGAKTAAAGGADVLVMDDGFQHMRLRRDLNIVLIDGMFPSIAASCLPFGRLREPASALRDADVIVITRTDGTFETVLAVVRDRLAELAPQASICLAAHRPVHVIDPAGDVLPVEVLAGRKPLLFCGIGNPQGFTVTVDRLGAEPVALVSCEDHCRYTPEHLDDLCAMGDKEGAEFLLTTQKDYVKIAPLAGDRPIWQLVVEMEITEGREELSQRIRSVADSNCD